MEKEKKPVENVSENEGQNTIINECSVNERTEDWDEYLEEILCYGIESWRGG